MVVALARRLKAVLVFYDSMTAHIAVTEVFKMVPLVRDFDLCPYKSHHDMRFSSPPVAAQWLYCRCCNLCCMITLLLCDVVCFTAQRTRLLEKFFSVA